MIHKVTKEQDEHRVLAAGHRHVGTVGREAVKPGSKLKRERP